MLLRSAAAGLVPVVTTERARTERDHAAKLVRHTGGTKTPAVQIRPAIGRVRAGMASFPVGRLMTFLLTL